METLTIPTQVNFAEVNANESKDSNFSIILVKPNTKDRATLAALSAIVTDQMIARRDFLLAEAAGIKTVSNAEDAATASDIAGKLKTVRNDIEKARQAVKRPVLDISEAIDTVAKEASAPAIAEVKRLDGLNAAFIQAEQRRLFKEQQEREAEARRAQEEANHLARQQAQEAARLKAEAEKAAASGNEDEAFQKEIEAMSAEQAADTLQAQASVVAPAPIINTEVKIAGANVAAKEWGYVVTDIHALYQARPECVELKEKKSVINAVIKTAASLAAGNPFTIPGLKISPKVNVNSRAR